MEPNIVAPVTGKLPAGTRVERFEDAGDFYRAEYNGKAGYVYKDFFKVVQ